MLVIAGGLGAQQYIGTSITIPSASGVSLADSDELVDLALNTTPIASDLHKTAPIQHAEVGGKSFFLNGIDRDRKYNGGSNVRNAYTYAPVRAPTVTGQTEIETAMSGPSGVCVTGGYIYVCDTGHHRILKFDKTTYVLAAVYGTGTAGSGNSELDEPHGICSDGTHLYVCDTGNDRIVKITISTLAYAAKIGTTGSGNDQFVGPEGICYYDSHIYVTDTEQMPHGRVVKRLASDLSYVDEWDGTIIVPNVTLYRPRGIAVIEELPALVISNGDTYGHVVITRELIGTDYGTTRFGVMGAGIGEWRAATGVGYKEGVIYVTDAGSATLSGGSKLMRWTVNLCADDPDVDDGTTDGKIKTTNSVGYYLGGSYYGLPATDDFWDLSAETDTGVGEYRGYILLADDVGAASVVAGSTESSAVGALGALPALVPSGYCVIGAYVAGPSCDFNGAAGLAAQGTFYDQFPNYMTASAEYESEIGSPGTDDEEFLYPHHIAIDESLIYICDRRTLEDSIPADTGGEIKIRYTGDLGLHLVIDEEMEGDVYGTRNYSFLYVDEDNVVTAESPSAEGYHGFSISNTIAGFHSMDPKVMKIKVCASKFGLLDERYVLAEITNNPAGTTWSTTDTSADTALEALPYTTQKRDGEYGLPATRRCACIWQDRLVRSGAILAPSYQVGTATVDADWSTDHGLWRVVGTNTHWTKRMEGRYFAMASAVDTKYQIVFVDETNQYLYLCAAYTGTTATPLAYILSDERDPSVVDFSTPGLYEDQPNDLWTACGLGDGDEVLALWPRGPVLYVFKRRSIYAITGAAFDSYQVEVVSKRIGCDGPNAVVEIPVTGGGSLLTFFSYPAIYAVEGTEEPQAISTFLDPLIRTTHEMASIRTVTYFDIREQVVGFSMPTSPYLVNAENYTFEYGVKKWCREPGPKFMATGYFSDANGRKRLCYTDEMGVVWQYGIGNAEGASDGDLTGTVTAWDEDSLKLTSSSTTFSTNLVGVPIFLVPPTGTFERNVIVSTSVDQRSIYLLNKPSGTVTTTWQFIVAGIERVLETGGLDQGITEIEKKYEDLWLDHELDSGTLAVQAAEDEDDFVTVYELDLSLPSPQSVPLAGPTYSFRGKEIRLRFVKLMPDQDMAIKGFQYRASWRSERA